MSFISSCQRRISDLSKQLDAFINNHKRSAAHREIDADEEAYVAKFHAILAGIADFVRTAEITADLHPTSLPPSDVQELVTQAEHLINRGILFGYEGEADERSSRSFSDSLYSESCIPSFAHKNKGPGASPLLEIKREKAQFSHKDFNAIFSQSDGLAALFQQMSGIKLDPDILKAKVKKTPSWPKTPRPSNLTSPCARFQIVPILPAWNATESNKNATAVAQARCEVSSDNVNDPIDLRISGQGDMLALSVRGGYKNRMPYLQYYFSHDTHVPLDGQDKFMRSHIFPLDLAGVNDIAVDGDRKLIFAADNARIKSYRYNTPRSSSGDDRKKKGRVDDSKDTGLQVVHTLDCGMYVYEGPLAVLPEQGRLLRAGRHGVVAVWDVDGLPTHRDDGAGFIGRFMGNKPSKTGIKPSRTVSLDTRENATDSEGWRVEAWHRHPSKANIMFCGSDVQNSQKFHCHAFDIEVGGKAVAKYLGHASTVRGFSTSAAADPNVFLTSCDDGYARLYDTRRSMPVITITAEEAVESLIPSAVLVHPDGLPFIFVGEGRAQKITLWDVRTQKALYELATGNNSVRAMVWDDQSNTLYAATTCENVDRNGYYHDYRLARIPKKKAEREGDKRKAKDERLEDEEEDEEDDGYDYASDDPRSSDSEFEAQGDEICWPKNAYHSENYWGHVWDAGDHRIYKYSFKVEPNLEILPQYGRATIDSRDGQW